MDVIFNEALTNLSWMAVVIPILVQLLKAFDPIKNMDKNFYPHLTIGVGILVGLVVAVATGGGYAVYILTGILGGLSASGVYDVTKSTAKKVKG